MPLRWLGETRDDVRFAFRQLRRAPGFTLVAVMTLALGVGANGAIFALVDATLLRPLPFEGAERLVMVWERTRASSRSMVSPLNLLDWSDRSRTFDRMAGFFPFVGGMVMNGKDGTAETVSRQWVTAGFFDVLGVRPILGRTFLPADDASRSNVVVLSEALWRSRFDSDAGVVGRAIRLDGSPYTVVGVVPEGFQLLGETSMWALRPIQGAPPAARGAYVLRVIGRLEPGVPLEAAQADLDAVARGLAVEFPKTNDGRGVAVQPMRDALIGGELRVTSLLFLGVVGFVLVICCANVASLLLARATVRTRELAMRSALGASRRRVVRQLLTESLVLSAVGGAAGVGVAAVILGVAPSVIPRGLLPGAVTLGFDLRVIVFCAAVALLVGLLFGLAPAWQATGQSVARVIAAGSGTTTGRGGRLRSMLVAGEVATAVVLLFGAGLLLRTLLAVESVDRGYRAGDALTMMVDPLGSRYPTDESLMQFFEAVEGEILGLPGVAGVAWASTLPLGASSAGDFFFDIVGEPPFEESQRPVADYQIASDSYFQTLDLPVVNGRGFDDRDRAGSVPVCIVNEAFVRAHLQGRSPIGVRLALRPVQSGQAAPVVREIVGVARQVKGRPDEARDLVQVYVPMAQNLVDDIYLVVRPASGPAEALAPSVRAAIGRVDREQLVSVRDVMTLGEIAREATARHRFRAVLLVAFAGLALVLAMVGVSGVLAYSLQLRLRDLAVRRVLGATPADVLGMVVVDAARVVAAGALAGVALSMVLGRLLVSVLFGVQPRDPLTFASVAVLLAIAAAVSIAGPARRAVWVDPAVALRGE